MKDKQPTRGQFWKIVWKNGSESLWPAHLWTAQQLRDMTQIVSIELTNEKNPAPVAA
jgi:hypothetical protein